VLQLNSVVQLIRNNNASEAKFMQRRLPPLNSLRTFEAAARHLNFTNAAEELCVTQAAISHQIKALEGYLGAPLFIRSPRKLELTETGAKLLPVVQNALDTIGQMISTIRSEDDVAPVSIAVAPSFAANWLLPRLDSLFQEHPKIELSLRHTNAPVDFTREPVDLAVTYGQGKWRGLLAQSILEIDFFPVCSPKILQGKKELVSANDLQHFTLLHDSDHRSWTEWFALAGAADADPTRGTIIDDTNVLIQAAVDGLGVAMGSEPFVREHISAGRLVRPFETTLTTDYAYFAVCPREHLSRKEVRQVWDWLVRQV
jgi:LysR family glycine cleavage system transcriptional activator